jgi:hypothetical protein
MFLAKNILGTGGRSQLGIHVLVWLSEQHELLCWAIVVVVVVVVVVAAERRGSIDPTEMQHQTCVVIVILETFNNILLEELINYSKK